MSEFNYGDPHPLSGDRWKAKRRSDERAASHYAGTLSEAATLYQRDADGVVVGLALFDRETANIRGWQAWSAQLLAVDPTDSFACQIARDFALNGAQIVDLRLHPAEQARWLDIGLVACRKLADKRGEGKAMSNLGAAWAAMGDMTKAIGLYEQSLVITRANGDNQAERETLNRLGLAWMDLGDSNKAISCHEQSLIISKETGDRRSEAHALGYLGLAWTTLGDANTALGYYEQSLEITCKMGDSRSECRTLSYLGTTWHNLEGTRGCEESYQIPRGSLDHRSAPPRSSR